MSKLHVVPVFSRAVFSRAVLVWVVLSCVRVSGTLQAADTYTPGLKTGKTFEGFAKDFLEQHCLDCHDDASKKGGLWMYVESASQA